MYCTKCGAPIPEGSDVCPQCTQTKTMPDGEVFQFHYESGMSSRSTTAIDHTITLQRDEWWSQGKRASPYSTKRHTRP